MKKLELVFAAIQIPLDYLMLLISGFLALKIRFDEHITDIKPVIYNIDFFEFMIFVSIAALVWILMFALNGLYSLKITRTFSKELTQIFIASSAAVLCIIVLFFFQRDLFSSRFVFVVAWLGSIIFVSFGRYLLLIIQRFLLKKGYGVHKIVIFGEGKTSDYIKELWQGDRNFGYEVVATYNNTDENTFFELESLVRENKIDEILLIEGDNFKNSIKEKLLAFTNKHHIIFKYSIGFSSLMVSHFISDTSYGFPIVEVQKTPLDGWWRIVKRVFDIFFGILVLIFLFPFLLIIALLVKLDSSGNAIYKNERIGYKGKKFFVYKFRTMKTEFCISSQNPNNSQALEFEKQLIEENNQRKGAIYKVLNDPRRTLLGKFLEKTSLDELPQIFNIIFGSMSFVGPRPHQEREIEKYEERHLRLLDIKPGLTGLAQISGRSDLDFEDEYKLDLYYIENWNFWFDIQILLKTFFVIFHPKHKA